MQIDHLQKCAHKPCVCQVTSSEEYCCDRCRENASAGTDTCKCGHLDCAVEPALADPPLVSPA